MELDMKRSVLILLVFLFLLSFAGCDDTTPGSGAGGPGGGLEIVMPWEHEVTFQTNGGTPVQKQTTAKVKTMPLTQRPGYVFDGWYLDISLTVPAVFPLEVEEDMTIYAKWLKETYTITCENTSIKMWSDGRNSSASWVVTPLGFQYDRLAELGYAIKATVTYDVFYKKDYDVLWDIGYMGAPKYEAFFVGTKLDGDFVMDQSTPKSSTTRTLSFTVPAERMKDEAITLTFSTDNIQNIIYFKNISVTYQAFKK